MRSTAKVNRVDENRAKIGPTAFRRFLGYYPLDLDDVPIIKKAADLAATL